jgi:competence protein ComEC
VNDRAVRRDRRSSARFRRGLASVELAWRELSRRHPRHVVLFALLAGLLLGPLSSAAVLVAAALAAAVGGRTSLALAGGVAVLAGATLAQARVSALVQGPLASMTGRDVEARAILLEPVRHWRNGTAVARVQLVGPAVAEDSAGVRGSFNLAGEVAVARAENVSVPPGVRVGSELRLRGTVQPLDRFDAYQRRRGAHAALEISSWDTTGRARGGLAGALDAARERAARALGAGLHAPEAALLRGMVLGQDEAIAADTRIDFQRSGLAHLLAVSGQNVMLLCVLVLAVGAATGLPLRSRLIVAMLLVALYVPLAGGGPSIQRAGVMGIAGLVAALAGRPASRWYALGLAAAVTLALNPFAAGEPGWQLSFAAVVGLLALAPSLRSALARRRVPGPIAEAAAITIAATVATAPLLALHFEQVSLASLPANLLAAAVVAPVMWLGMLGIALAQVSPVLATPLNVLCAPLLGYVEWVAHAAAQAPLAAVPIRIGGPVGLTVAYACMAGAIFAGVRGARRLAGRLDAAGQLRRAERAVAADLAGGRPLVSLAESLGGGRANGIAVGARAGAAVVAAVLALAVLGVAALRPRHVARLAPGELVVSFLDVGQGDATLLQRGAASVLVDTGPPGGPILRRLDEAGVGRLDLLVLTHAETDHEGMALPVIAAHRPRLVLDGGAGWPTVVQHELPAAMARAGGRAVAAHAGQVLQIGELRVRVLWPPVPPPAWRPDGNPNDRAVVAHVQDGAFDLLLPADAETNVTAGLDLPRVEALKVAHHGSVDDGLPAMLERTAPQVAAIEVGAHNTYGHPAPSTLGALRVVPNVVRTDRDGTVRLHVADGRMRLERAA